uniref:Uncharacterized protein n=1 Tax=Boldia erythrosiphon TaxID=74908 RepID=A0A1X9PV76_9RHOD|nr:hypothetical protein [Boldia erythrosiphon]ARO90613.1 hypothetical protein [Boldia erythrosiphon]
MFLGQTVRIVNLLFTGSPEITTCLGKQGIVRGLKFTQLGTIMVVVEFKSHLRLCFFKEELEPI